MNVVNSYRYGGKLQPNTFIGGVASTINTPALLADKLSCSESDIKQFQIVGDDITCYIGVEYSISNSAFASNTDITFYRDADNRVIGLGVSAFEKTTKINRLEFNGIISLSGASNCLNGSSIAAFIALNCTYISPNTFVNWKYNGKTIVLPKCSNFGGTTGDDSVFGSTPNDAKLYVPISLQTNNGGLQDGDLDDFEAQNGTQEIVFVQNYTLPSAVTDLAVSATYGSAIELTWSAPTSINTIDFYEIWVDGMYNGQTTNTTGYALHLDLSTTYEIKVLVRDIYYNGSDFSNTVTATTNATYTIPTTDIISYWNLNGNSNDSVGSNNGVDTAMSYTTITDGIGQVADFTAGTSSKIQVADDDSLSFGNGTTDTAFSGVVRVNFDIVSDVWILNKRGTSNNTIQEWQVYYISGKLTFALNDASESAVIREEYTITFLPNVWYEVAWSYDGTNQPKLYIDGVEVGTARNTGTYVAMENTTAPLVMGKASWDTNFSLDGYLDEIALFDTDLTAAEVSEIYSKHQAGNALI